MRAVLGRLEFGGLTIWWLKELPSSTGKMLALRAVLERAEGLGRPGHAGTADFGG